MQVQQEFYFEIVFTLIIIKVSTIAFFQHRFRGVASVALLVFFTLCSVFKVQLKLTLLVENSGIEPLTS